MIDRIYLSPPHMSGAERLAVSEAFDSNFVAPAGPFLQEFELSVANALRIADSVALSSGTAAIHLALRVLDLKIGDEVFCSTLTFCASANPIVYERSKPYFIDSDPHSWNMDPCRLEDALRNRASRNRLPKAIVVVDIFGQPADMRSISELANRYDVPVIQDAAESLGATYHDQPVGAHAWATALSFNGNKIITTGGGGMLCSNDSDLIDKARFLATQARDPAPHYEHSTVGFNYRMSNIAAAIGVKQIEVLHDRVCRRREIFSCYERALSDLPGIEFMPEAPYGQSNRWLTVIQIDSSRFGASRDYVRTQLEEQNIESRPVWKPLHLQPVFSTSECEGGEVAERLFRNGLCLPSGSSLSEEDLGRVCSAVRKCFRAESSRAA